MSTIAQVSAPSSSPYLSPQAQQQPSSAGESSSDRKPTTIRINPRAAARLWKCGDITCENQDMTSKPRKETGRKFISDFFGRNKSETGAIPEEVWAFVCRKDYQRSKYASEKSIQAYMTFWLSALKTQFIRVRLWRPEATFQVKLLNRAEERLNTYNAELVKNGDNNAAAQAAVLVLPTTGKKGIIQLSNADAIDPLQAQHIKTNFAGIRSIDDILNTIYPWIEQSLRSGALSRMPPIEFLIKPVIHGDIVNSEAENYQMWRDFIEPKWSQADHDAAIALISLHRQPIQPMILTWEAYNAAVAAHAATLPAADAISPTHDADTEPEDDHDGTAHKDKGKSRMIEEAQEVEVPGLVYNGNKTLGKKRKIKPATEPPQNKHLRSSF